MNLIEHELIQLILEESNENLFKDSAVVYKTISANIGIPREERKYLKMTKKEHFLRYQLSKMHNVLNILKKIDEVLIYIKIPPNHSLIKKGEITKTQWIQYHYVNFIGSVVTLLDVILIFTNLIYSLGNPEEKCTYDLLSKNTKLTKESKEALKDLESYIAKFRRQRNNYLHKGEKADIIPLDDIELFELYLNLMKDTSKDSRRLFNRGLKIAKIEIIEDIQETKRELLQRTIKVFDSLLIVYKRNKIGGASV